MSLERARNVVRDSRSQIIDQIDALARRAGVDRLTMARALQEGFNRELGQQDSVEDEDEGPRECEVTFTATYTFTVDSQEELDAELDRVTDAAEGFGFTSVSVDADEFESYPVA